LLSPWATLALLLPSQSWLQTTRHSLEHSVGSMLPLATTVARLQALPRPRTPYFVVRHSVACERVWERRGRRCHRWHRNWSACCCAATAAIVFGVRKLRARRLQMLERLAGVDSTMRGLAAMNVESEPVDLPSLITDRRGTVGALIVDRLFSNQLWLHKQCSVAFLLFLVLDAHTGVYSIGISSGLFSPASSLNRIALHEREASELSKGFHDRIKSAVVKP